MGGGHGAGLCMNGTRSISSGRLLGGEILADGRAGPTSKSYKKHRRSGPMTSRCVDANASDDNGFDRTSSEQLPFFGRFVATLDSSPSPNPSTCSASRTGRSAVGHLRLIMGWNGFAVMTLALGAKTDAPTDEWQTRT